MVAGDKDMESYAIFKTYRPSARTGKTFSTLVEWTPDRQRALQHAREIRAGAGSEVEAVAVVDYAGAPWPWVIDRLAVEERAA